MKNVSKFLAVSLLTVTLASCGTKESQDSVDTTKEFNLVQEKVEIDELGKYQVLECKYGDEVVKDVEYTVTDDTICEVVNGVLLAKKAGKTTITAKYTIGDVVKEDICSVTISSELSVSFTNEGDIFNKKTGETLDLDVEVKVPHVYEEVKDVVYTTSNKDIATVDADGVVTCKASGIVTITATTVAEISSPAFDMMGKHFPASSAPAEDSVTIIIDNEFNKTTHADLLGKFEGHYDWQGFTEDAKTAEEKKAKWTKEKLTWIRSKSSLTFKEDGTFEQQVLNAQRFMYKLDTEHPENSKNCYVYNRADQKAETIDGKEFGAIAGMPSMGMHNFSEKGAFAIINGELNLCYKGKISNIGAVADNAWAVKAYKPFTNMVPMNPNMTMVLTKKAA